MPKQIVQNQETKLLRYIVATPIGNLQITGNNTTITHINVICSLPSSLEEPPPPWHHKITQWFQNYFNGKEEQFPIPINPNGTEFQKSVWALLQDIPYGTSVSYLDLAQKRGSKNHARAIGGACGKNPILIVIPCHRVRCTNHTLGGFSAGIPVKQYLLNLEQPVTLKKSHIL